MKKYTFTVKVYFFISLTLFTHNASLKRTSHPHTFTNVLTHYAHIISLFSMYLSIFNNEIKVLQCSDTAPQIWAAGRTIMLIRVPVQFVFRQFSALTAQCRISTLELPHCAMKGQDAVRRHMGST